MSKNLKKYLFNKKTLKKGILISAIVGSILNIINQGELIMTHQWDKISFFKLCLTYLTPFTVSVYSTTTALRDKILG